jgi:hypothetical protein
MVPRRTLTFVGLAETVELSGSIAIPLRLGGAALS